MNKKYREYLLSNKWKKKAKLNKKLAKNKCNRCGSRKRLQTHHKTYANIFNELQEDLECLCYKCHAKEHENMNAKEKTENGNNFRLEGMILNWVFGEGSCNFDSSAEISFYLYIMRMNIGYGQVESKRLSYNDIKDACKTKSRATISKVLKSLKEKDLIKKVESNSCDKEFKQAYKYQLVFRKDLGFPNLGKFWKDNQSIDVVPKTIKLPDNF